MPKWDKGEIKWDELYQWYRSKNPEVYLDQKRYKEVIILWGELCREYLLEGREIPLYHGFKTFSIRKKYRKTYLDRKQSKIQGKPVYGSNSHSSFFTAGLWWVKRGTKFNVSGWKFKAGRKLNRELAVVMKNPGGHRKFVENIVLSGTAEKKQRKRFRI